MRIVIGVLALTAACGDDGNMFPVGGGGNDGGLTFPDSSAPRDSAGDSGGGSGSDATVATVDANQFVGRVCLLTDPRDLNGCADTGAGGLTVRLGTATAVTAGDGSFTIEGQSTAGLTWRITGPNIVSSFEVLADYFIPAMTITMFDSLTAANNVDLYPGEGSMFVFVSKNGEGVAGKTADVNPEAFHSPFYDGATTTAWEQDSTGSGGAVWLAGIDVGTATVTVDGVGVTAPVFDGGITFANIILP